MKQIRLSKAQLNIASVAMLVSGAFLCGYFYHASSIKDEVSIPRILVHNRASESDYSRQTRTFTEQEEKEWEILKTVELEVPVWGADEQPTGDTKMVSLKDGNYHNPPEDQVYLDKDTLVLGNFEYESQNQDAIIVMWTNPSGTGNYPELALFRKHDGKYKLIETEQNGFGDRDYIRAVKREGDQLFVDMITSWAGDGGCCPSHKITQVYDIRGGISLIPQTELLGRDLAIQLVKNRPEIKSWLKILEKAKDKGSEIESRPIIEFDRMAGDKYVVHVYEFVKDSGDTGHSATLGWYHVDLATKAAVKQQP